MKTKILQFTKNYHFINSKLDQKIEEDEILKLIFVLISGIQLKGIKKQDFFNIYENMQNELVIYECFYDDKKEEGFIKFCGYKLKGEESLNSFQLNVENDEAYTNPTFSDRIYDIKICRALRRFLKVSQRVIYLNNIYEGYETGDIVPYISIVNFSYEDEFSGIIISKEEHEKIKAIESLSLDKELLYEVINNEGFDLEELDHIGLKRNISYFSIPFDVALSRKDKSKHKNCKIVIFRSNVGILYKCRIIECPMLIGGEFFNYNKILEVKEIENIEEINSMYTDIKYTEGHFGVPDEQLPKDSLAKKINEFVNVLLYIAE